MLTRKRWTAPNVVADWRTDRQNIVKSISDYLLSLEAPDSLSITEASIDDTVIGGDSPDSATFTDLTTTGNTVLGDASSDTLNVGNGDIIKNASGIVGIGVTPGAWGSSRAVQLGARSSLASVGSSNPATQLTNNSRFDGSNHKYLETAAAVFYSQGSGDHLWGSAASGTAGNTISYAVYLTLKADGRLYGSALHNNAGAITGTTDQHIASQARAFTPTLTHTTNIAASTAYPVVLKRVGNVVTVSGKFEADVTGAGAAVLEMSLPIASNIQNDYDLAGVAFIAGAAEGASILGSVANDRAVITWTAVTTTNAAWSFFFQYEVR